MPNYNNGKIYKIWSPSTDLTYIGSTCNKLHIRLFEHRANFKAYKSGNFHYMTSFGVLEQPDHRILLVENYPCQNRAELNRREGEVIQSTTCINKNVAGRTKQEYMKKYCEVHKDKIKDYKENHKEEIKEKQKEYRENNKEEILEKKKEYYENNKEEILGKASKPFVCGCGSITRTDKKAHHMKTKKHQAWVETHSS